MVEERETGVMTEEVEASLEEVDAMSRKFSLSLKTLCGKELEANFYHITGIRATLHGEVVSLVIPNNLI